MKLEKGRSMPVGVAWGLVTMLALLVAAYGGKEATAADIASEQKWKQLVADAQAEGQVNMIIGNRLGKDWEPILAVFEGKYGIKIRYITGSSTKLSDRTLAERRAGSYEWDIMLGSPRRLRDRFQAANSLREVEPLLIDPNVTDNSLWAKGRKWWYDTDTKKYILMQTAKISLWPQSPWFNTELLSVDEAKRIDSLWEFVKPEWRGKIVAGPPLPAAGAGDMSASHPDYGKEWAMKFMDPKHEVLWIENVRLLADSLARGKRAVAINLGKASRDLRKLRKLGLPVDEFQNHTTLAKTAMMSVGGGQPQFGALTKAPHPRAAQLFLNWIFSKEGQTARQTLLGDGAEPNPTLRVDGVPRGKVVDLGVPDAKGEVYWDRATPELAKQADGFMKWARQTWKQLYRR